MPQNAPSEEKETGARSMSMARRKEGDRFIKKAVFVRLVKNRGYL
jgi:hypothetical protein